MPVSGCGQPRFSVDFFKLKLQHAGTGICAQTQEEQQVRLLYYCYLTAY